MNWHYSSKKCRFKNKFQAWLDGNFLLISNSDKKCLVFPLPCLPSLEVDLMICTVGCDVSKLWSSTAGVSFNSILVFFPCFFQVFSLLFFFCLHNKKSAGLYFSGSSEGLTGASNGRRRACFPSLYFTSKVERGKFKKVTWPAEKHHHAFIITT